MSDVGTYVGGFQLTAKIALCGRNGSLMNLRTYCISLLLYSVVAPCPDSLHQGFVLALSPKDGTIMELKLKL